MDVDSISGMIELDRCQHSCCAFIEILTPIMSSANEDEVERYPDERDILLSLESNPAINNQ